jgi:outer membrane protein insertion porin family
MPLIRTSNEVIDFEKSVLLKGPIAYFNRVTVAGNDKTNDYVIYRELKNKPDERWNKELVIKSRELGQLGFLIRAISPDVKNPDPVSGTVDLDWKVVEKDRE